MSNLVQGHPSGGYILEELHVGMAAEKIIPVTEERIQLFADASDDYNPVHLDEEFARRPDIVRPSLSIAEWILPTLIS